MNIKREFIGLVIVLTINLVMYKIMGFEAAVIFLLTCIWWSK